MKNGSILLVTGFAMAICLAGLRLGGTSPPVAGTAPADGSGTLREVTAYNVGIRQQTSDDPCLGASGENLCRLVRAGRSVCAANFVALGTILRIEDYGECIVLDRMHRRFSRRVDIAMNGNAVAEALEFGVQRRLVRVKD